jgi:hypothetical protein
MGADHSSDWMRTTTPRSLGSHHSIEASIESEGGWVVCKESRGPIAELAGWGGVRGASVQSWAQLAAE